MAPFKFKLEQVLRYRQQLEEKAMQILAKARAKRDATRKRIAEIDEELLNLQREMQNFATMTAGERYTAASYHKALREERKTALIILQEQDMEVDLCRQELVEKSKERSLLDKLKEKQALRHAKQELLEEQRTNDETATLRFKPATY